MTTRQQLISDIELRLYKSKPSDDSELEKSYIAYLIDLYRNQILQDKLNDDIQKGKEISPFYHIRETNKPLIRETGSSYDPTFTKYRYYITTEKTPLTLINERGIIRVNNNYGKNLAQSTSLNVEYLEELPYGGISTASQAFYREEGNKLFILSSSEITQGLYKYDALYIPMADADSYADTDDYPLEDDLIPVVLSLVEETLMAQMVGGAVDLENDGTDPYHNK